MGLDAKQRIDLARSSLEKSRVFQEAPSLDAPARVVERGIVFSLDAKERPIKELGTVYRDNSDPNSVALADLQIEQMRKKEFSAKK